MAKIIVAGAGQGGLVAGIMLARRGFQVDIFESSIRGEVSYPWYDDIRFEVFEEVGLPLPPRDTYTQKSKWLFVAPDRQNSLAVPPAKPMEEISISRRGLSEHLLTLAEEAGCTLHFEHSVLGLIVEGDRVVGVNCLDGEYRCDLVIDATGFFSMLRAQVPARFGIQAQPAPMDTMTAYRAFFRRCEDSPAPEIDSTLIIKHNGGCGISWCNLNDRDEVDILIGRIGGMTPDEKGRAYADIVTSHAIAGGELIVERDVNIAVRAPIARMVADGYVLVGDSAFMTMPIMGSGIESSMIAGKILAEEIRDDSRFTAAELWEYQREFMDELGEDYIFIDVLKRWLLDLPVEDINWVFGAGIISSEELALISTAEDSGVKLKFGDILKKFFKLCKRFHIVSGAIKRALRALRAKSCAKHIPKEYDEKKIARWQRKYESFIR